MVYIINNDGRIVTDNLKNDQEVLKFLIQHCYVPAILRMHESMKERIEYRCNYCGFKVEKMFINIQSSKPVWGIWTGSNSMDTR